MGKGKGKGKAGDRAVDKLKRQRDVIDVRRKTVAEQPTAEQAKHAVYVERNIVDTEGGGRIVIGRAHRRQARFETISELTSGQLRALRLYRQAFDQAERSEVKSQLDFGVGGGSGGSDAAIARIERLAFAKVALERIEARIPPHLLATLRAVALHDRDWTALAIERFGSRTVERIDASGKGPAHKTTQAPKSGKHRERMKGEFLTAAAALTDGAPRPQPTARTGCPSSLPAPPPAVDPAFLDEHGRMLSLDQVRDVILDRFAAANGAADGDLTGGTE